MRRIFRIVRRLILFLVVVVVVAGAGFGALVWMTLPGGNRVADIPGLSAPVQIDLDPDGIPRIHAQSETDAAAALGFLHARDRMFQMDMMRRAAAGDLSEVVGPQALPLDRMVRTLGVRASAERDLTTLPPATRAVLEAYARGVNAWIAARGRFSGLEFLALGAPRPWAPVDTLLWAKTMGLYLSGNWRTELARAVLLHQLPQATVDSLWPDLSGRGQPQAALDNPAIATVAAKLAALLPSFPAPYTLPATASDEWAVDGRHSDTGAPLLAGDPHLAFSMPGIWYLARIDTPQGVLAGATAPGVPFLVLGHNSHIAWSFTTTGADVQDVFEETPVSADQYATPDGPRPFTIRQERIHVRGAPDEVLDVRETRHGPVISDLVAPNGPILAVEMANLAPGDTAAAGLQALNHASTVEEAGAAAAQITSPVQNMAVADRQHIALYVTGRVPIRKSGDGSVPAPGADGSHDWIGWASGDQLPHIVAPDSGRIVNGNERVAPPDFPVFLGRDWFGEWRARRIRALLSATDHHSLQSFAAMQVDVVSSFAQAVLPRLRGVKPADEASRAALVLFSSWNGAMSMARPQPLIFNAWMDRFHAALLGRLGVQDSPAIAGTELTAAALAAEGGSYCGGDCGDMLSTSLAAAIKALQPRFGDDPAGWRWGRAHRALFAHPLFHNLPVLKLLGDMRISVPGDDTTLFRGGMRGGSFVAIHGASYRGVYDLADLDRSLFVVAPGQSGNAVSSLAWNFVQRWRDGGTVTLGPAPASVSAHIELNPTSP
jgi:penicillin amidase